MHRFLCGHDVSAPLSKCPGVPWLSHMKNKLFCKQQANSVPKWLNHFWILTSSEGQAVHAVPRTTLSVFWTLGIIEGHCLNSRFLIQDVDQYFLFYPPSVRLLCWGSCWDLLPIFKTEHLVFFNNSSLSDVSFVNISVCCLILLKLFFWQCKSL